MFEVDKKGMFSLLLYKSFCHFFLRYGVRS